MYKIALCEDEKIFSDAQEEICRNILEKLHIEYHISTFKKSTDLLQALSEKGEQYDLLLLDIVMDGIDGMSLAHKIRETDDDTTIIFVTSNPEYALQGYDVHALHYLMKPVNINTLEQLIVSDYKRRFVSQIAIFDSDIGKQRVDVKNIVCLETVGRRVEITLINGKVHYSGKLTVLLGELPQDMFVRCHQAFAVNMEHIREITRQDAIAMNGKRIPISRTFAKDAKKAFLRQLRQD